MAASFSAAAETTAALDGETDGTKAVVAVTFPRFSMASTADPSPSMYTAAQVTEAPERATKAAALLTVVDGTERSWEMNGTSQETVHQGFIAPLTAPGLHDLQEQPTIACHSGSPFSFPATLPLLWLAPMEICVDNDMAGVLGSAVELNLHISQDCDGRKTEFSRQVSSQHAQRRIASALGAAAIKTRPPRVPASTETVVDALADCVGQQMIGAERTPTEEENAFSDGVAVQGHFCRAIKAVKLEEKRRREAEVRETLGDSKQRSSSRRRRSAGLCKEKGGRRKAQPAWDHFRLREEWKAGNIVTL